MFSFSSLKERMLWKQNFKQVFAKQLHKIFGSTNSNIILVNCSFKNVSKLFEWLTKKWIKWMKEERVWTELITPVSSSVKPNSVEFLDGHSKDCQQMLIMSFQITYIMNVSFWSLNGFYLAVSFGYWANSNVLASYITCKNRRLSVSLFVSKR